MNSPSIKQLLIPIAIATLSTLGITTSYADNWQPVLAVGLGTATAYDVGSDEYFAAQPGISEEIYNYSANNTTQTSLLSDIFLGVEKSLSPKWALQVGLDYNQISPFTAQGVFTQGVDAGTTDSYTYQYAIATKQLSLEGKLLYTFKNIYHPYVLAGVGAAFNRAQSYSTNASPFLTFTRMYADNTETSFSPTVGIGFDTDITSTCRVGIGYRFTDLGKVQLGDADIDDTSVSGTISQSHLYSSEVLAQITWAI